MAEEKQTPIVRMGGPRGGNARFMEEKPQKGGKTLIRLMKSFSKEKGMLILLFGTVSIGCISGVLAPHFQASAIDHLSAADREQLILNLVWMSLAYLVSGFSTLFQGWIAAKLSQIVVKKMRGDLFEKIINLPIQYLDHHSHGDIMSRMTNDVENISNIIAQSMSSLISGILTIIGTVVMMMWYCWQLALLSCTTVLMTVIIIKLLSGAIRRLYKERQKLLGDVNGIVEEKVTGYRTVTAYNQQENVICEFDGTSDCLKKTGIWAESLGTCIGPIMNCISNMGFVVIAAFGGWFTIKGMISIGVISAFIIYAKQFARPINDLANLYAQIQTAVAGAERIYAIMDEPCENKRGTETIRDMDGTISFRNVNFSYCQGKPILHDFNLEVRHGEKVALVGATGSGKTTVVNLLMRFYDVDSGEIFIDGTNIQEIALNELRRNIAIVLQDTVLFSDTIRNNLKYSNSDLTDEAMEEAAKMSFCDGMIRRLPDQYDTKLIQEGTNLSQGQRQLLSICRAFLADAKILILDEATSSVDTRTEKQIQDAMMNLMKNHTSLIIAHRLSTIQDADKIVVMDQGHIAEIGRHNELLAKKGRYYELYMTQFSGRQI